MGDLEERLVAIAIARLRGGQMANAIVRPDAGRLVP
jgi:hypothetical protein